MTVLDLCSRNQALLIGGVNFGQSLLGEFAPTATFDERAGLCTIDGKFTLVETIATPESLDPELNTRWRIGQTVDYWVANTAGTLVPHPHLALRILHVPIYTEPTAGEDPTLEILVGCELRYWDERSPAADCSGVDPRTGLPAWQVMRNLLLVAGLDGSQLTLLSAGPTDIVNYPLQKFAGESFVRQAGMIALTRPGGGRYLWADGQRRIRIDYLDNTASPTLSLTAGDVIDSQRTRSEDYARPFERLKINSSRVIVRPVTYPNTLPPEERYATMAEAFPDRWPVPGVSPTERFLIEGLYATENWDGIGTLTRTTRVRQTYFIFAAVVGTLGINGPPGRGVSTDIGETGEVIETWRFHPRPASWDSCRPERNPASNAGLIQSYIKEMRYGKDSFRINGIVQKFDPRIGRARYRQTVNYTYDSRQNLVRQRTATELDTANPAKLLRPTGLAANSGQGLVPYSLEESWVEDITWVEESPGSNYWNKTTRVRAPGGNLNNDYQSQNGEAVLPVIDGTPIVENNSPPEAPTTMPTGFSVAEEALSVVINAPPRGGGIAEKERPIDVRYAHSEAQLQSLGQLYASVAWGRAYGREFVLPLLDSQLDANTYKPLQRWRFTDAAGVIRDYRVECPILAIGRDECVLGGRAGLIGVVGTAPPPTPGNPNPDPPVLPPYQPVTVATGSVRLSGQASDPAIAILEIAGSVGLIGRENAQYWRTTPLANFRDLSLLDWRNLP